VADNLVEIVIGAKDTATPDLDALKARLDELGRKVETAKVGLDGTKESEAQLLRLNAMYEAIGKRVERLSVKPDDASFAKAGADILALELRFDRLREKMDKPGIFSKAFSLLGHSVSAVNDGLGSMLGSLPLVGGAFAAMGGIASAVLIGIAALAAVALGPLIAGLGLATVGFGAFALGVIPEIKKVETALTATGKAGKKAWAALTPGERQIGHGIDKLQDAFHKITKAVQPEVIRAFGTALNIIKQIMPALTPLAKAAGKALDGFLKDIDKWLKSPSGKKFIEWMEKEGPKAIATFGHALTDIVHAIGIVMYWWDRLGNDVIKFVKAQIPLVVHAFDSIVHAIGNVIHAVDNVIHAIGNVVHAFGNVIHAGGNVAHAIGNIVNAVKDAVTWFGNLASAANNALGGIPGKILGSIGSMFGFASGGVVGGAAAGGPRSGWTLVGEMGPELVRIPPGSQVMNNAATSAMLAGGGGSGGNTYNLTVQVPPVANPSAVGRAVVEAIREFERGSGTRWRT
jgi:phage-related protein